MGKANGSVSSTTTGDINEHIQFIEIPQYQPPKSGILAHVPASWVPYGELMRIDKPTGIYLFYFPHLFGTLYVVASAGSDVSISHLLWANLKLLLGTVFMRAAACAWNDNLDREYDRKVRRCRLRPLARGALTPYQGYVFTAVLTVIAAAFLLALPTLCHIIAIPSIALLILYPFTKRFTDFPQLILGFQVAIGILLGMAAVDPDAINNGRYSKEGVASFYLMNVAWTLVYDTVYAQQDVEDDAKAGVRSMAVRFRNGPRLLLTVVVLAQMALLGLTGKLQGFGAGYFSVACGGTLLSMIWMLGTIDLKQPAECMWWFKNGCWLVGLSISGGLALEAFS
ncbi:UbiA prenyltransferase [Corynespora cassiicola Philippines]|uniref:4-hydroxybenzoate polyprenyltransferase, mitochondrial n=1 Tax=Corynespora cassiicola Philippines TaxID=1448308 RepID=A0A2T2PD93_CORCC|nr:UbiA prenyltransferase [Corynespora cassiicola Philippines]